MTMITHPELDSLCQSCGDYYVPYSGVGATNERCPACEGER